MRVILENVERRSRSCWSRFGKHVGIDGARSHDLTLVESRFTRVLGHGAPGERLGEKKVSISPERKIPPRRRARLSVSYRHAKSRQVLDPIRFHPRGDSTAGRAISFQGWSQSVGGGRESTGDYALFILYKREQSWTDLPQFVRTGWSIRSTSFVFRLVAR